MNKSKMISATALATVMSASAVNAELAVNGYANGYWTSSSNATGSDLGKSSETLTVSYSGTMDNGMGLSMSMLNYGASADVTLSVSSDMGSLSFGTDNNTAADAMDGMPAKAGMGFTGTDTVVGKDYADGDTAANDGLKYTSPSINGWTIGASTGFSNTQGTDTTGSIAVSGALGGVNLAAGVVSHGAVQTAAVAGVAGNCIATADSALTQVTAVQTCAVGTVRLTGSDAVAASTVASKDDTFMTASYALGDITLGYGMYSSDATAGDSATSIGISMPFAGMTAGFQYGEADNSGNNADDDGYRIGLVKSMGAGASFSVEYTDIDLGAVGAEDTTAIRVGYAVGF
jgi:hypothetical protein